MSISLDIEERAGRVVDALACVSSLLGSAAPGIDQPSMQLAQLLDLIADEARAVLPTEENNMRRAANDEDD